MNGVDVVYVNKFNYPADIVDSDTKPQNVSTRISELNGIYQYIAWVE
jgi:hypothetical protein